MMNTFSRVTRGFPSPLFRNYTFLIFHNLYGETLGKLGTYYKIIKKIYTCHAIKFVTAFFSFTMSANSYICNYVPARLYHVQALPRSLAVFVVFKNSKPLVSRVCSNEVSLEYNHFTVGPRNYNFIVMTHLLSHET